MWRFSVYLLFFLGMLQTGTCYQCYTCMGLSKNIPFEVPLDDVVVSADCVDPIQPSKIPKKECSESGSICVKGVTELSSETQVMLRGCMTLNQCKTVVQSCYGCEGELCNTASTAIPSLTVFGIISLVVLRYYL